MTLNNCGCGGEAFLVKPFGYIEYAGTCKICGAIGPMKVNEAEALYAWNRAHPDNSEAVRLLRNELAHLLYLLEPLERAGTLSIPGLATLNGAREAIRQTTIDRRATPAHDSGGGA